MRVQNQELKTEIEDLKLTGGTTNMSNTNVDLFNKVKEVRKELKEVTSQRDHLKNDLDEANKQISEFRQNREVRFFTILNTKHFKNKNVKTKKFMRSARIFFLSNIFSKCEFVLDLKFLSGHGSNE